MHIWELRPSQKSTCIKVVNITLIFTNCILQSTKSWCLSSVVIYRVWPIHRGSSVEIFFENATLSLEFIVHQYILDSSIDLVVPSLVSKVVHHVIAYNQMFFPDKVKNKMVRNFYKNKFLHYTCIRKIQNTVKLCYL